MHYMITVSLIINILVLIPVCLTLLLNFEKMNVAAGIFTPARGILLAILHKYIVRFLFLVVFHGCKTCICLVFDSNRLQGFDPVYREVN